MLATFRNPMIGLLALCAILFESFIFVPNALANQGGGSGGAAAQVYGEEDYNPNITYEPKNTCEESLFARGPLVALGYFTGILTLYKTLKDPDRRKFIFWTQPINGLINAPISVFLATSLAWTLTAATDTPFPNLFTQARLWNMFESWGSYNATNAFRDAATLDKTIPEKQKYALNIWYSWVAYTAITAGAEFAKARTENQFNYAWSLVAFAMMWPFFSRFMGMKITKYLFEGFPKDSEMNYFKLSSRQRANYVTEKKERLKQILGQITVQESLKTRDSAKELILLTSEKKTLETNIALYETSRADFIAKKIASKINAEKEEVKFKKRLASAEDFAKQHKQDLSYEVSNRLKLNIKYFKEKISKLNDEARSAEKVVKRLRRASKDIAESEELPSTRLAQLRFDNLAWSTGGAVMMTTLYFLSRWFLVGQSAVDPTWSHPLNKIITTARNAVQQIDFSRAIPSAEQLSALDHLPAPTNPSTMNGDIQAMQEALNSAQNSAETGSPARLSPATIDRMEQIEEGMGRFLDQEPTDPNESSNS